MDKSLTLRIVTPNESTQIIECDSINFQIPDDVNGRGAGAYGILPNFQNTVLAIDSCRLIAKRDGQVCFAVQVGEGTVNVENNAVTVLTEQFTICEQ